MLIRLGLRICHALLFAQLLNIIGMIAGWQIEKAVTVFLVLCINALGIITVLIYREQNKE